MRRYRLTSALVAGAVCLLGAVSLNMVHSMNRATPALFGLELGGEAMPCVGWTMFSSLMVSYYAALIHMEIRCMGYMELMRYGSYLRWRGYICCRAVLLCAAYVGVALATQFILDGRYVANDALLKAGLAAAGLMLVGQIMQCIVFQWAYLKSAQGERVLALMVVLNAVGAALGYVYPKAAVLMPTSWSMLARSREFAEGGYSVALVLAIELVVIAAAVLNSPGLEGSAFMTRDQSK